MGADQIDERQCRIGVETVNNAGTALFARQELNLEEDFQVL